jgi:hypothetical protein
LEIPENLAFLLDLALRHLISFAFVVIKMLQSANLNIPQRPQLDQGLKRNGPLTLRVSNRARSKDRIRLSLSGKKDGQAYQFSVGSAHWPRIEITCWKIGIGNGHNSSGSSDRAVHRADDRI